MSVRYDSRAIMRPKITFIFCSTFTLISIHIFAFANDGTPTHTFIDYYIECGASILHSITESAVVIMSMYHKINFGSLALVESYSNFVRFYRIRSTPFQ